MICSGGSLYEWRDVAMNGSPGGVREVVRYFVYSPTCDQEQQFGSLQEACRCHGYRP